MTCHITMERISSPLAPHPPLNAAQRAFLALHDSPSPPHTWRWHFVGTQLRATADAGAATIWKDDLDALVRLGLLKRGVGVADCYVTALGRQQLEMETQ